MPNFSPARKMLCANCQPPNSQPYPPRTDRNGGHYGGMHCIPVELCRGKSGLSRVDLALLAYIIENPDKQGARAEIADGCDCAPNSIPRSLRRLTKMGLLPAAWQWQRKPSEKPKKHAKKANPRKGLKKGEWSLIAVKSDGKCFYCSDKASLQIDHVIPVSRGGIHHVDNMVLACAACNATKSDQTGEEFLRGIKFVRAIVGGAA